MLVLTGAPSTISFVVFIAGVLLAVLLGRRTRMHVREEGSASRDASALLAIADEDDVSDSDSADEVFVRPNACGDATADAARERLQAARAWGDGCATIDRPIVLVEPAAWLPEETLETMLNSLPAGAEVTIVEPDERSSSAR